MLPDRVSNPGPLTYESGALPIALRGPAFIKALNGNPNTCLLKIEKQTFRALIDYGAEVSLMHPHVYNSLKIKPKLQTKKAYLHSVNGDALQVDGIVDMPFEIGGLKMSHTFYVVRNMNRKLI